MSAPTASGETRATPVIGEYIAVKPGHCGGKPHVIGHRIKVEHVAIWHERMGMTARQIVESYPPLTLSAVYAALAYYHDHRAEIDADIREGEEVAQRLQANQPSLLERIAAKRPDVGRMSAAAVLAYVRSGHCPKEDIARLRMDLPKRLAAATPDPDLAELQVELSRQTPA